MSRVVRTYCGNCNYSTTVETEGQETCLTCLATMTEIPIKDISLEEYERMLSEHDWFTGWSDDDEVIRRGERFVDYFEKISNHHKGEYSQRFAHHNKK